MTVACYISVETEMVSPAWDALYIRCGRNVGRLRKIIAFEPNQIEKYQFPAFREVSIFDKY